MENYATMKSRHQKAFNDFKGIGFAFSNEQFTKMCDKLGIKEENAKEKLFKMGAGGYILKAVNKDFHKMCRNNDKELKEAMKAYDFALSMFNYELANHEYAYTYDLEPTLDALGLTEEQVISDKVLFKALKEAMKNQKENDCWNS